MDKRKDIEIMSTFLIVSFWTFLWIFSFPVFYYTYCILDRVDRSLRSNEKINSDPLDDMDSVSFALGTIFSPIATVIVLSLIAGKILSIYAVSKVNSVIDFKKDLDRAKKCLNK